MRPPTRIANSESWPLHWLRLVIEAKCFIEARRNFSVRRLELVFIGQRQRFRAGRHPILYRDYRISRLIVDSRFDRSCLNFVFSSALLGPFEPRNRREAVAFSISADL